MKANFKVKDIFLEQTKFFSQMKWFHFYISLIMSNYYFYVKFYMLVSFLPVFFFFQNVESKSRHQWISSNLSTECLEAYAFHFFTFDLQGMTFSKDPECGKSKGCYSNCADNKCTMLMSWAPHNDTHFHFSIEAFYSSHEDFYVAMGFSTKDKMVSDAGHYNRLEHLKRRK